MEVTRVGVRAAVVTWAGLAAVAVGLGVRPDRPITQRTDLFFQCDAGGLVTDAVSGADDRGRGVHPLLYFVWTAPLHRVSTALSPSVDPHATATYGSLLLVLGSLGVGVGVLAAGLAARGVRPGVLAAVAPAYLLGTGQTLAVVPDHFGISQGILAAAFGVFAWPLPVRRKVALLAGLTLLAFGVTVTNALFPALLLAVVGWPRLSVRGRAAAAAGGLLLLLIGAGLLFRVGELRERFVSRVELYLTYRLTDDPAGAAARAARGVIDSAVGPTPAVRANNLERLPMLTHEPPGEPYRAWPYDPVQSAAAVAWLLLLAVGTGRAVRSPADRGPVGLLWLWVVGNALFHNVWGDEYFLYTPHYSWALAAVAVVGWGSGSGWRPLPLALLSAAGGAYTLARFRTLLDAIPA